AGERPSDPDDELGMARAWLQPAEEEADHKPGKPDPDPDVDENFEDGPAVPPHKLARSAHRGASSLAFQHHDRGCEGPTDRQHDPGDDERDEAETDADPRQDRHAHESVEPRPRTAIEVGDRWNRNSPVLAVHD